MFRSYHPPRHEGATRHGCERSRSTAAGTAVAVVATDMANTWARHLLDLPHALLEYLSNELPLPAVGRLAAASSLLRDLIAANEPLWQANLQACGVSAHHQPRLALRSLTTLEAVRWADATPRLASDYFRAEAANGAAEAHEFQHGQPNAMVAHATFVCNAGKTLVVLGVETRSAPNLCAWALDLSAQEPSRWREVATVQVDLLLPGSGEAPCARTFTADGGGGGVLRDKAGREWLCVFGGLVVDQHGRPRYRDNETWLLGPLGAAADAHLWHWWEVQADGEAQSAVRPTPRFHHSQSVMGSAATSLLVCGGHNFRGEALLELAELNLGDVDLLAASASGPPQALGEVAWGFYPAPDPGGNYGGPDLSVGVSRHAAVSWGENRLIIVGGEDDGHPSGTSCMVWLFDTAGERWWQLPSLPYGRSRAAAAVVRSEWLVVCGGEGEESGAEVFVLNLPRHAPSGPGSRIPLQWPWVVPPGGRGVDALREWAVLSLPRGLERPRHDATLCVAQDGLLVLGGGHNGACLDHFGDAHAGFCAEGETCVWRLRLGDAQADTHFSVARCCMSPAGLLIEPISETDPAGHRLTQATQVRLHKALGRPGPRATAALLDKGVPRQLRLVDTGEVADSFGPPDADAPYEVRVVTNDAGGATCEKQVPLSNVRPSYVNPAALRVTLAVCAGGVVAVRGWRVDDAHLDSGMSARRLAVVP